jgi:hypothetical protein
LKQDGRCGGCPAKSRVDETGKGCKTDPCDLETSIIDDEGYCIECGPYLKPDADGESCHRDTC